MWKNIHTRIRSTGPEIEYKEDCKTGLFFGKRFDKTNNPMETEILQQRAANGLNVESSVVALSHKHAAELFNTAMYRLLNINKWHTLPCSLLTELKLTDSKGLNVDRQVRENDYVVINNKNGKGEWVKIERVFLQSDPSGLRDVLTIRARPSCNPLDRDVEAIRPSNTFEVTRQGLNVTASVYGKNEEDVSTKSYMAMETERPDLTVGAIPGVARVQWRSLVNGILSTWS